MMHKHFIFDPECELDTSGHGLDTPRTRRDTTRHTGTWPEHVPYTILERHVLPILTDPLLNLFKDVFPAESLLFEFRYLELNSFKHKRGITVCVL
ncbi:65-kda microtubule-associated protein 3 [Phtheirospermum japonicum]|uniref:65-kDa microtubule-associated protein 3 n=1 Tax=Phtheirospermum japonicum TaxID=374723 RepID=A0A830BAC9_9LAMI|nr:65-kda microtubule-associated protein 3 [Phtheirospermum japonicum]